ncbi:MAG: ATP-binding protein [Terrimicrobiaceae bacterium]
MATLSGGSTVSDNAFATIFDIPLFGQLDDSQRACFFRGQWQWNPAEALPHNFAVPFFTTKGGSGTGLGLVISHRIVVERHHGKIDFSTGPDGTQFNVRLPFESPPALSL